MLILSLSLSYILGSIPFGFLVSLRIANTDIRTKGSGNIGATNVARVIGLKWGVLVFILDLAKGTCALLLTKQMSPGAGPLFFLFAGLAAVCGHNWPVFLRFRGGKGVSTSLGVVLGLCLVFPGLWLAMNGALLAWALIFFFSRIVSIASLSAAAVFFLLSLQAAVPRELKIFSFILFAFIVVRHWPNISNLIKKKEHRF